MTNIIKKKFDTIALLFVLSLNNPVGAQSLGNYSDANSYPSYSNYANTNTYPNYNNSQSNPSGNLSTKRHFGNIFNFFHRHNNALIFSGNGGLPTRVVSTGNGNGLIFPGNGGTPSRFTPIGNGNSLIFPGNGGLPTRVTPMTHIQECNDLYQARRDLAITELQNLGWPKIKPNKATFYMWLKVPPHMTSQDFCTKMLEEAHIVVPPGTAYGPNGEGYFRISLCVGEKRLKEAFDRMKSKNIVFGPSTVVSHK